MTSTTLGIDISERGVAWREALGGAIHDAVHPGHPWSGCANPDKVYDVWMPAFLLSLRTDGFDVTDADFDHAPERLMGIANLHKRNPESARDVCKECRRTWPCGTIRFVRATAAADAEAYALIVGKAS